MVLPYIVLWQVILAGIKLVFGAKIAVTYDLNLVVQYKGTLYYMQVNLQLQQQTTKPPYNPE